MQGRPPTARPTARGSRLRPMPPARGRPTTAKATCRATASMRDRPRAWLAPTGVAPACVGSARGQAAWGSRPWPGRRGAAARYEAARDIPVARAAACKGGRSYRGSAHARRHCSLARCRPRAIAPAVGAAAHADGVQCRHLRRAETTTTTAQLRVRKEG
ncbi:hypothetical protein GW17_00058068 [Ensete ventricosum]|nr:hypothetical protein GW17_00058068 [Ensete ventricosum]